MIRSPRSSSAFTLIEMITVIAIIAIIAGLILAVNGLVQKKSAMARAEGEIRTISSALESYKTDNGGYPQGGPITNPTATDLLDPRKAPGDATDTTSSGKMAQSSLYLYEQLSGDTDGNGTIDSTETSKNYLPDFFKQSRLGGPKINGKVTPIQYIMDPFGNPYGYSTAGLLVEQEYRTLLSTNASASRSVTNSKGTQGYNPTFDLWSTAGDTTGNTAKWAKNW
ncbi:MAG TPA: prepilin-type N-terminal cleavage/methylation domain-containing protein [Chthoniobacter sp.]|nr:prepilin-type N-terminal cleavage/methylation domain-containing protein [Chthoniobacter sp.]